MRVHKINKKLNDKNNKSKSTKDTIDEYDLPPTVTLSKRKPTKAKEEANMLSQLHQTFNDLMTNHKGYLDFCRHHPKDPVAKVIQEMTKLLVPKAASYQSAYTLDQRIKKIYSLMDDFKKQYKESQSLTLFDKDEKKQLYKKVNEMFKLFESYFLLIHPHYKAQHESTTKTRNTLKK